MDESWMPSMSSATAESNAAEMAEEPTPRSAIEPPEPEPPE